MKLYFLNQFLFGKLLERELSLPDVLIGWADQQLSIEERDLCCPKDYVMLLVLVTLVLLRFMSNRVKKDWYWTYSSSGISIAKALSRPLSCWHFCVFDYAISSHWYKCSVLSPTADDFTVYELGSFFILQVENFGAFQDFQGIVPVARESHCLVVHWNRNVTSLIHILRWCFNFMMFMIRIRLIAKSALLFISHTTFVTVSCLFPYR